MLASLVPDSSRPGNAVTIILLVKEQSQSQSQSWEGRCKTLRIANGTCGKASERATMTEPGGAALQAASAETEMEERGGIGQQKGLGKEEGPWLLETRRGGPPNEPPKSLRRNETGRKQSKKTETSGPKQDPKVISLPYVAPPSCAPLPSCFLLPPSSLTPLMQRHYTQDGTDASPHHCMYACDPKALSF
jgi:hypothetical protein